jgi:hypothetical protein
MQNGFRIVSNGGVGLVTSAAGELVPIRQREAPAMVYPPYRGGGV